MRPEEIQKLLRKEPFQPFRIYVTDGSVFEIRHPETVLLTQRAVLVGRPQRNGEESLPSDYDIVALLHVTRLEPISARRRPAK